MRTSFIKSNVGNSGIPFVTACRAVGAVAMATVFAAALAAPSLVSAPVSAQSRHAISPEEVEVQAPLPQDSASHVGYEELLDGTIVADGQVFQSWAEYVASDYFRTTSKRCGTPNTFELIDGGPLEGGGTDGGSTADCTLSCTNPLDIYAPSVVRYRIPVVVHVIQNTSGTGFLSTAMVQSQIQVLNEDFLAIAGSLGAPGTNVEIEFALATLDPNNNPTTGILYHTNNTWFNDGGSYWNTIAWNPHRFLNIYTNTAGGALGYVPFLPQQGGVGSLADRVVIHYQSFGNNSPGFPYHKGRTATHEVGHYLGLYHTFQNGCGTVASGPCGGTNCHTTGDRCCDTNAHSGQQFGCPFNSTCGDGEDPRRNYMNYTDDLCMWEFKPEQARRMRCTLEHYRPLLYQIVNNTPANNTCANAIVKGVGSHAYSTVGATTTGPDEPGACTVQGYSNIGNDIWFKHLANCTGTLKVSLCGASFDTKMAAYLVCPTGSGQYLACNDDFCGLASEITFPVVQGTVYQIRIGGWGGQTGTGTMVISCTPAPPQCPADCTGDNVVNANDLLLVINSWGPCTGCAADVTGDNVVNANDLLMVINAWGPCP